VCLVGFMCARVVSPSVVLLRIRLSNPRFRCS
jgi:hypothetical protein